MLLLSQMALPLLLFLDVNFLWHWLHVATMQLCTVTRRRSSSRSSSHPSTAWPNVVILESVAAHYIAILAWPLSHRASSSIRVPLSPCSHVVRHLGPGPFFSTGRCPFFSLPLSTPSLPIAFLLPPCLPRALGVGAHAGQTRSPHTQSRCHIACLT